LLQDRARYRFGDADDVPWETDFPGYGRVFPHPFGPADGKYFTTLLTLSPAGDEMTLEFAKALIANEKLGADETPDYLSISFSSNDYVHHLFGAASLEAEDNLLQLDRRLAELFAYVDNQIGLRNTLIVLSADHGTPEVPGYLASLGDADAHLFDSESVLSADLLALLQKRFGAGKALVADFAYPYIYLNHALIAEKKLVADQVARVIADHLATLDGVTAALTAGDIVSRGPGGTMIDENVYNNFLAQRSGDVHLVLDPNSYINDFDGLVVASTHGSLWRYDTHVPVIFAGFGLRPARVSRRIAPYDIATTLAHVLDAQAPNGAVGEVLDEVVAGVGRDPIP
jgi:predicted AlkP superfamily pyrophosphatase or phosphodiesterase